MRATILVDAAQVKELRLVRDRLARWTDRLAYRSDDEGCDCCVHSWDVDAPPEALAELPSTVKAETSWTRHRAT